MVITKDFRIVPQRARGGAECRDVCSVRHHRSFSTALNMHGITRLGLLSSGGTRRGVVRRVIVVKGFRIRVGLNHTRRLARERGLSAVHGLSLTSRSGIFREGMPRGKCCAL